jgi:nitrate/TMAO reductase-like tetraheme cytochrome c subunit
MADCSDCHKSESFVRFDVIGVNCVDCHRNDYEATTNPNHKTAGFSEECSQCHPVNSLQWAGAGFNHNFFPLVQGHSGLKCADCHKTGNYADASPECISCHQQDYNTAANPNHVTSGFPTNCSLCHNLNPGWSPATFKQHDSQYFPISSGAHKGITCAECHPNPSNYADFTCISCHAHNKTDMDNRHREEGGYSYNSAACYHCHPTGKAGDK